MHYLNCLQSRVHFTYIKAHIVGLSPLIRIAFGLTDPTMQVEFVESAAFETVTLQLGTGRPFNTMDLSPQVVGATEREVGAIFLMW